MRKSTHNNQSIYVNWGIHLTGVATTCSVRGLWTITPEILENSIRVLPPRMRAESTWPLCVGPMAFAVPVVVRAKRGAREGFCDARRASTSRR